MYRLLTVLAFAQASVVLFTDLDGGANTRGENNNGTIVTIQLWQSDRWIESELARCELL